MSIRKLLPYPYDPRAEQEPTDGGQDWRLERPPDVYVVADASSYGLSTQKAEGTRSMKMGAPPAENAAIPVYRLRVDVAQRLGLAPGWSPGSAWSPEHAKPEHQHEAQNVGLHLQSAISFTQLWDWRPLSDLA